MVAADETADIWAWPLAAGAGVDRRVTDLLDGWCCRNGRVLSVDAVRGGLAELAETLAGAPLTGDPAPSSDVDLLAGELADTSWGRGPLHTLRAPSLPWERPLELTDQLPEGVLGQLLDRPDCHPQLPWRVPERCPRLLVTSPAATRAEHVLAAPAARDPANRGFRRGIELRGSRGTSRVPTRTAEVPGRRTPTARYAHSPRHPGRPACGFPP